MEPNDQREITIWYGQIINITEKHDKIKEILSKKDWKNGNLPSLTKLVNRCNCDYRLLLRLELEADNHQDLRDINHAATEINEIMRNLDLPSAMKLI